VRFGGKKKPDWMSYEALKLVKNTNKLYAKYRNAEHPSYAKWQEM
jgi:hypothetical protein